MQQLAERGSLAFPADAHDLTSPPVALPQGSDPLAQTLTARTSERLARLRDLEGQLGRLRQPDDAGEGERAAPGQGFAHREAAQREQILALEAQLRVAHQQADEMWHQLGQRRIELLRTEDHRPALEQALRDAQQEIYIISPWMNRRACNDALCDLIAAALRRGVRVVIGFGMAEGGRDVEEAQRNEYNTRGVLYALRQRCPADALARLEVYRTQGTHQKLLVQDEALGITSTFNWLSYVGLRDAGYRSEMGVAVRDGEDVRRLRVEAQETLRGAERVRP